MIGNIQSEKGQIEFIDGRDVAFHDAAESSNRVLWSLGKPLDKPPRCLRQTSSKTGAPACLWNFSAGTMISAMF